MDQNPAPTPTPNLTPEAPVAPAPAAPAAPAANKNTAKIAILAAIAVVAVAAIVVAIILLTGNKQPSGSGSDESGNSGSSDTSLSKCGDAFKCLEKIDEDATVESINALTGIEGKVSNYSDTTYIWEFPNDESLSFTTGYFSIEVDYETKLHKDSSVNLEGYNNIKDKIKTGATYDELVSALGGKKGLLYKKDSFGTGYLWVDGDGGYLRASVSASGKITFVSGWF